MPVIKIEAKNLPLAISKSNEETRKAIVRASNMASERGRGLLVSRTPVDRGAMRAAWRVVHGGMIGKVTRLARIENKNPMIGVVEGGARPHPVSAEGREAIAGWVRRVIGGKEKDVQRITMGIVHKLRLYGQKPTYFIKKSRKEIAKFMKEELVREFNRIGQKGSA